MMNKINGACCGDEYIDDDENDNLNELTDSYQVISNSTSFIVVLNKILH